MKAVRWIFFGLLLTFFVSSCHKGAHHYGKKSRPLSKPADGGMMGR